MRLGLSLRENGLPKREPRNSPKGSRDRLTQFYLGAPTTASRPCRRYEKPPHGTSRKCGDTATSLPRGVHTCVQESRPHTVRDPVAVWRRDLRIGARAWAGAARRTALLLSGQGSPRVGPGPAVPNHDMARSFVRENRGPTWDLLPLFYLRAPTTASPHTAPARGNVSRQPAASVAPRERDFRCVSRDTRATSGKGV